MTTPSPLRAPSPAVVAVVAEDVVLVAAELQELGDLQPLLLPRVPHLQQRARLPGVRPVVLVAELPEVAEAAVAAVVVVAVVAGLWSCTVFRRFIFLYEVR